MWKKERGMWENKMEELTETRNKGTKAQTH